MIHWACKRIGRARGILVLCDENNALVRLKQFGALRRTHHMYTAVFISCEYVLGSNPGTYETGHTFFIIFWVALREIHVISGRGFMKWLNLARSKRRSVPSRNIIRHQVPGICGKHRLLYRYVAMLGNVSDTSIAHALEIIRGTVGKPRKGYGTLALFYSYVPVHETVPRVRARVRSTYFTSLYPIRKTYIPESSTWNPSTRI